MLELGHNYSCSRVKGRNQLKLALTDKEDSYWFFTVGLLDDKLYIVFRVGNK